MSVVCERCGALVFGGSPCGADHCRLDEPRLPPSTCNVMFPIRLFTVQTTLMAGVSARVTTLTAERSELERWLGGPLKSPFTVVGDTCELSFGLERGDRDAGGEDVYGWHFVMLEDSAEHWRWIVDRGRGNRLVVLVVND